MGTPGAGLPPDLLSSPAALADPFPAWERLRHEAPIWHDPIADRWVVSRSADVLAVLRDRATYAVARPYRRFSDQGGPTLVNLDGPPHPVRRGILAPEVRRISPRREGPAPDGAPSTVRDAAPDPPSGPPLTGRTNRPAEGPSAVAPLPS